MQSRRDLVVSLVKFVAIAKELASEGVSYPMIAAALGVGIGTAHRYANDGTFPKRKGSVGSDGKYREDPEPKPHPEDEFNAETGRSPLSYSEEQPAVDVEQGP